MSIEIKNIGFRYTAERDILKNVSFTAEKGRILSILGPNGTGKTTLLKCINNILVPFEGEVLLNGESIRKMPLNRRAKAIAYVPQYVNNIFLMKVIDVIMLGRTPYIFGKISSHDKDVVFEIIKKMGLEKFAFKYINEISGGERQRVYIARALAQEPSFLLLDEPTSSLDLKNQLFVLESICDIVRSNNMGAVLTIHDLNLSAMFSDKIIMMKDSEVFAEGKPRDVITEENICHVYGVQSEVCEKDGCINVRIKRQ
ncbi:ABC transporter ATP-binding protein [Anaerotignum faecicola]|nr:ABC transporter ATP-binding protein [Anaerotignum faecicola]